MVKSIQSVLVCYFLMKNWYQYWYVIQFSKSVSVRLKSSKSVKIGISKNRFKVNRSIPFLQNSAAGPNKIDLRLLNIIFFILFIMMVFSPKPSTETCRADYSAQLKAYLILTFYFQLENLVWVGSAQAWFMIRITFSIKVKISVCHKIYETLFAQLIPIKTMIDNIFGQTPPPPSTLLMLPKLLTFQVIHQNKSCLYILE